MTTCIWQVPSGLALQHRGWEDGFVVFNNLSGDTHLLDEAAMLLLLAVAAGPGDTAAVTEGLRASLGLDDQEADDIPAMLSDLLALSLIEAAPC